MTDPELCARLEGILALDLADDRSSWELDAEGSWGRVAERISFCAQERLTEIAVERGRRRRSPDLL